MERLLFGYCEKILRLTFSRQLLVSSSFFLEWYSPLVSVSIPTRHFRPKLKKVMKDTGLEDASAADAMHQEECKRILGRGTRNAAGCLSHAQSAPIQASPLDSSLTSALSHRRMSSRLLLRHDAWRILLPSRQFEENWKRPVTRSVNGPIFFWHWYFGHISLSLSCNLSGCLWSLNSTRLRT